ASLILLATRDASAQEPPTSTPPVEPPAAPLVPSEPVVPSTTQPAAPGTQEPKPAAPPSRRPVNDGLVGDRPSEVYSEDWWAHTRPIREMHGYFRTRGELFHNFSLGRHTKPGGVGQPLGTADSVLWAQPLDHSYGDLSGNDNQVLLCHDPDPAGHLGR